jgi:PAS domain S-box-containing protein
MHFPELRHFIEDAPIGAAMFDRDMRYIAFSPRWLTDHRIGDIALGQSHYDVFPEIPARWKDVHRRALAGEVVCETDDHFERAEGLRIWLKWEVRPWRDAEDAIGGIIIFTEDISAQKRAEAALKEALARQRLAQSAGHIGIWDWEIETGRAYLNDEWYDLFGVPRGLSLGYEDFLARVHPEDRPAVDASFRRALAGDGAIDLDYRIFREDTGELRWISSKGEAQFDNEGRAVRAMGAVHDITERKEMERALRESARRKNEFLATLAHELRNPLTPISNAINVLMRMSESELAQAERKKAVIGMARRQVDHLARLVNDLLDLARIDNGKIRLETKLLDIVQLLPHAVELVQPKIDAKRHLLATDFPDAPIPVHGDPARLTQIFANLLDNAAKYTDAGGRIEIAARREGDAALVTVRDNGDGIPPQQLTCVFDMFTQIGESDAAQGGLGVGLALARSLVALHDGQIEARSEGPGRGSEFVVRLPLAGGEAAGAAPTNDETP